ncbi:lysylphosphatidylglycerol synthase domain-containing protein [Pseudokineococcus sp. 5B2Z-1]|uniref:lysylphosphatidylglycerol synthase domain-containing protein n=1 Tax=Pseudokineococcus sp. 5B2Z-1 TaxID=3132744 RepID=UPI00309A8020
MLRALARPALRALARVVLGAALLVAVLLVVGREPAADAAGVLRPPLVLAALALGLAATTAQALRWRAVVRAFPGAAVLARRRAVAEYLRAQALDVLVPGGVAGSAARAVRGRGGGPGGTRASAAAVVSERAVGVGVLLAAGAAVLATRDAAAAVLAAVVAVVALAVAAPALRRLGPRAGTAVVGWSVLGLAPLLLLFVLAADEVLPHLRPGALLLLATAALAGMAVPAGVGGFGPREAATASAAALAGLPAADGATAALAYGLLVLVAAAPGAVLLGVDVVTAGRATRGRPEPSPGPQQSRGPEASSGAGPA